MCDRAEPMAAGRRLAVRVEAGRIFEPTRQCIFCCRFDPDGVTDDGRPACRSSVCRACGARVCDAHTDCPVCFTGLLDNRHAPSCGYLGCLKPSVAKWPRVGRICLAHLRAKGKVGAERRELKNSWREWVEVAEPVIRPRTYTAGGVGNG